MQSTGKMHVSQMSGQTVGEGRYRLQVKLGSGNFGTVYRAEELLNGSTVREVALKLFSPDATRLGNVEGMLQDCSLPATILASPAPLEHKRHFVQIYGFGKLSTPAGECAYVAMELIRGGTTLETIMKQQRHADVFPREAEIIGLMQQFFTALALAHKAGVLHRDIKGANVMLENGVVRVMDFGMGAYLNKPDAPLQTTMSIYAPENFEGRYAAASDIYQAALMFYEYYTGYQPYEEKFGGGDMIAERKKRLDFVYRPGSSFKGVNASPLLDAILSRCLAYTEEARFRSAQEVLAALEKTDLCSTLEQAAALGDYALAQTLFEQAMAHPDLDDPRRVRCLRALAKAHADREQLDAALELLKQAFTLAEQRGIFFHLPSERNALIDDISLLYLKKGQGGMARIFAQKKK